MSWDSGPSYGEDELDDAAWGRLTDAVLGDLDAAPVGSYVDVLSARAMLDAYQRVRRTRDLAFWTATTMLLLMPPLGLPVLFLPTLGLFGVAAWLTQRHDVTRARGRRLAALLDEAERQNAPDARMGGQW